MSLFRHSAKNFWIFLKKYFAECHGEALGKEFFFWKNFAECLTHGTRQRPRELQKKKLHSIVTDNIYIHQSSHLYHQHALYITSTRIFNKSIENPSQMHQSSTSQVYYYKFNITKFNIPTAAMETAGVAPWTAVKDRTVAKGWRD